MRLERHRPVLRLACANALAALALIVWSLLDPRPVPLVLAMSVGQALGTASFVAFLLVVADDLRRAERPVSQRPGPGEGTP